MAAPTTRLLRAGFAAVIVVFVAVMLLAVRALNRAEDSNLRLVHAEKVLAHIQSVLTRCVDAETGIRGFLLTNDERFLRPFDEAKGALPTELDTLAALTADNRKQQGEVEQLRKQVDNHIDLLRRLRLERKRTRPLRPRAAIEQQDVMDRVRATLHRMETEELRLVQERMGEDARAMRRARALGTLVFASIGGLLIWVYVLLDRDERRRAAGAVALREANDTLERRVQERTAAWAMANAELAAVVKREQQARGELESASRLKDEFLMTVSHELRTPLNTIHGWVRMLQAGTVPVEQRARALEVVERNTRAQARLVEDLLDVSRIVSGKLQLKVRRVELRAIVQAVVESMRPAAAAKSIEVEASMTGGPFLVMGDPDRLQQVVWNFLSNALKFTPTRGQVAVMLDVRAGTVRLTVMDSGIGIAREFVPFVFERFRQGDSGTTRAHGGLGLGLAIVRHLVELHGGSVEVDSPGVNQGTTFRMLLPLARPSAETPAAVEDDRSAVSEQPLAQVVGRLDGRRVLVVDDEAEARALLSHVFEHAGALVTTAASSREAWALLQLETPDVLVSDIEMPGEDGYTLMRRVRGPELPFAGRMVAVAVTAHARPEDRMRALQAGYQWHVPKPLEPAELVSIVASLLSPGGQANGPVSLAPS
jgi:signal transduction histidine kinase/ActR/RegA family two-component response regulator